MPAKETILDEAIRVTCGERNHDYGNPLDNHERTAILWEAYLKMQFKQRGELIVTPEDICFLNILQKIAREINRPKRDNLVDIAGWARNVEVIQDARGGASPTSTPGGSGPSASPPGAARATSGCTLSY